MKPISQLMRRMRDAVTPAERPLVVFVFAEPARPPEAETPGKTLPHLDIELAISVFERADMSEETRTSYTGELRRQAEWLDGRPPTDRLLAEHLDMLDDKGRAPSSAVTAVAADQRAVRELALEGYEIAEPPAGPLAARRLKRFRREGAERGPGQVRALTCDEAELMCKTAKGDGDPRGKRDAAIIGVMADGLMRVSEVSGLNAEDVSFRSNGTAEVLVRRSKTDQYARGEVAHLGAVATKRLRSWIKAAGIKRGPCSGRWTAGGGSRTSVSGRTRCAPRSSGGRARRGSGAGCPATRCASARRRGWPKRARRWSRYRRRAAGSRPTCPPTTYAARRRPVARWLGCAPPRKSPKNGRENGRKRGCAPRNGGVKVRITRVNRMI